MPKYAMVIDLQRCVGCGACSIACRNENNVSEGIYWSSKITETSGTFPNVRFHYRPTLCNHCTNPPCVQGCPTKAMHKQDNGITMHDPKKCIGCRYCMYNCPYEVIYFNWQAPHKFWKDPQPVHLAVRFFQVAKYPGIGRTGFHTVRDLARLDSVVAKGALFNHALGSGLR